MIILMLLNLIVLLVFIYFLERKRVILKIMKSFMMVLLRLRSTTKETDCMQLITQSMKSILKPMCVRIIQKYIQLTLL